MVARLEEAGAVELLLTGATGPAGYRSSMPAPIRQWDEYGSRAATLRRPVPSARDITRWTECRTWINGGIRDDVTRRVVGYRMLVWWETHPRAGERVHSWRAVGLLVGLHHETAQARWLTGVGRIVTWLRWQRRPTGSGLCARTGGSVGAGQIGQGGAPRADRGVLSDS